ncbi:hypothetical protein V493_05869 [Pseudogymnoascus sp. VKM F-4281 (FW-2241)]|nr:hypothetical protein V493_05869 [Pseudogymnoascus sp. VKM F-4281 (FW-2241)]
MAANPPISPPPYEEKSPRTPRFSDTNPQGIPNFGTPVKTARKITRPRTRYETPGSVVDKRTFRANPDVAKELLVCLSKGWAPEKTSGNGLLCGVYALYQAFRNIMGGARAVNGFGFGALRDGIDSDEFRAFHKGVITNRMAKTGLQGSALEAAVKQVMDEGNFGHNSFYSVEELSVFVRYINEMYEVQYRLGLVTTTKGRKSVASAYIVESDDPFNQLHYSVLWLHNVGNAHWESFGPRSSPDGRIARHKWKLTENLETVVNNGLYLVKLDTQGAPDQYTLTARTDQWVFQVAPPLGLEPRDGFIYVHTTKGPNSDSWRVVGESAMDTIRDQEGFIPLANLEVVNSYKNTRLNNDGKDVIARKPTDILAQRNRPRTPPPPPGPNPFTPGPTPGKGGECTTLGGAEGGNLPGPTTKPPIVLPQTPKTIGATIRETGPETTQTGEPQAKQPEPPVDQTQGPRAKLPSPPVILIQEPVIVQPTPLPAPRPKEIDLDTPLTIKTLLARREFAPPPHPQGTRSQSLGSRPRLPPSRPKSRTMAEFTATRNRKDDWARTRFLNFFIADVPDADETGERFGSGHDQPYHQDQVLLALDETYEPGVLGPVRVRTIDEDEGWAHSANLRKVTDPFGLDVNSATTQYSMDPNEAFREDLYPTSLLRGLCQGSGVDPNGSRQEIMAGLTAYRNQLGVPLILYRLIDAVGVFAKGDLVRVPGDPLANPEQFFRAFGLEPHKRGYLKGGDLVTEPRSWGARVRPHVHELRAPSELKWAQPPNNVTALLAMGSKLSLHGVDTPMEGEKGDEEEEGEEERQEREAGFAPAATVVPSRHPGQVYLGKDGRPSFFTALPASQTGRTGETSQRGQTSRLKRRAEEDIGGNGSKRRASRRLSQR